MAIVKRHWLLYLILFAVLAAGIWWHLNGRHEAKQAVAVVKADNRVLAEGIVYPIHYTEMAMPVDGMVGEVLVKEGDKVKAGQPIVRLVRGEYQDRVGSARSSAVGAAAAVEQSQVNLIDAEREMQRQQRLEKAGAVTRQKIEQAETVIAQKRAALAQAQAERLTGEEKVAESQKLMDKTELRALIDGTVAFLDVNVGEHATVGKILVRIADQSGWEVRSDNLTELAVAKVKVGDAATLMFDGIPGLEITGRLKFIRSYGEKKRGDMTYTVFFAPDQWDERLRWNMTAQIAITPSE